MKGLNLHAIVRGAINSVHPDETITLYQSIGQQNDDAGRVTPLYAEPQTVKAQVQSANNADLEHVNNMSQDTVVMRFYLFADVAFPPAPLERPFARGGDMIQRADGTWWLVTGSPDDFARVGWVCVLGTLQILPPAGIDDGTGGTDDDDFSPAA